MSKLQDLARKENYALFQLHGMLGNLVHLEKVNSVSALFIRIEINGAIKAIKNLQEARKVKGTVERKTKRIVRKFIKEKEYEINTSET